MKIMVDVNIVIDVAEERAGFVEASSGVLEVIFAHRVAACFVSHAVTTTYFLVKRSSGKGRAEDVIDEILAHFVIVPSTKELMLRARKSLVSDFEDAIVAVAADMLKCEFIVTRDVGDFKHSAVKAIRPEEFMRLVERLN